MGEISINTDIIHIIVKFLDVNGKLLERQHA